MNASSSRPSDPSRRTFLRCAAGATAATVWALPRPAAASVGRARPPVDVRVSHDGYLLHVEPSLAANPADPGNLLGSCMVGDPANGPQFIATYASFDGGKAWQSNGTLPMPAGTAFADDTTVAFTSAGRGFVCAMATSGLSRNNRGVYVWHTDDGGRTFAAPVAAMAGQFADHPWLAAEPSPDPGPDAAHRPGRLYAVWVAGDHAALGFTRSVDGGDSFEPPRQIRPPSDTGSVSTPMVAAGPGGLVCAIYEGALDPSALPEQSYQVEVVSSTDAGLSFGAPVVLGQEAAALALPGDVGPVSGPTIAAAPRGGALYAAFTTHRPGTVHSDIAVTASFDNGQTWSAAAPATPADQVIYFQPQMAVDMRGRVALSAFALTSSGVDVVLFTSPPGMPDFGPPRRVTRRPFDPALGPTGGGKHGAWWIGDYQGLAAAHGSIHPFWNDTRTGRMELFTAAMSEDHS